MSLNDHEFLPLEPIETKTEEKYFGWASVLALIFFSFSIVFGILWYRTPTCLEDNMSEQKLPKDSVLPIAKAVNDTISGSSVYNGSFNHIPSPYHRHLNLYDQKPSNTIKLLSKFQTYQQTFGWTCGAATALMVLNYFKYPNINEDILSKEQDLTHGASVNDMIGMFKSRGFNVISSNDVPEGNNYFQDTPYFTKNLTNWLENGIPVMIKLGGHWSAIIGFDDMGKPNSYQDFVLILADSWDTHDHRQDGYIIYTFDYFWNLWSNSAMRFEPTKYQQFVVAFK